MWSPREIFHFLHYNDGFNTIQDELKVLCSCSLPSKADNIHNNESRTQLLNLLSFICIVSYHDTGFFNRFNVYDIRSFIKYNSVNKNANDENGFVEEIVEAMEAILCLSKSHTKAISTFQPPLKLTLITRNNSEQKIGSEKVKESAIFMKQVDQHMVGHVDIGFTLWPSATILSHLFANFPYLISNKSCLEIGAGLGLSGIAAAKFARSVVISDYNDCVLEETIRNVAINTGPCMIHGTSGIVTLIPRPQDTVVLHCEDHYFKNTTTTSIYPSIANESNLSFYNNEITAPQTNVSVRHLDWTLIEGVSPFNFTCQKIVCSGVHISKTESIELKYPINNVNPLNASVLNECSSSSSSSDSGSSSNSPCSNDEVLITRFPRVNPDETYDVVFGSDMVASQDDAIGVAVAVKKYLKENGGMCLFVCPMPQHRWSNELIIPALQAVGIIVHYKLFYHSSYATKYQAVIDELLDVRNDSSCQCNCNCDCPRQSSSSSSSSKVKNTCGNLYKEFFDSIDQATADRILQDLTDIKDSCGFQLILGTKLGTN